MPFWCVLSDKSDKSKTDKADKAALREGMGRRKSPSLPPLSCPIGPIFL